MTPPPPPARALETTHATCPLRPLGSYLTLFGPRASLRLGESYRKIAAAGPHTEEGWKQNEFFHWPGDAWSEKAMKTASLAQFPERGDFPLARGPLEVRAPSREGGCGPPSSCFPPRRSLVKTDALLTVSCTVGKTDAPQLRTGQTRGLGRGGRPHAGRPRPLEWAAPDRGGPERARSLPPLGRGRREAGVVREEGREVRARPGDASRAARPLEQPGAVCGRRGGRLQARPHGREGLRGKLSVSRLSGPVSRAGLGGAPACCFLTNCLLSSWIVVCLSRSRMLAFHFPADVLLAAGVAVAVRIQSARFHSLVAYASTYTRCSSVSLQRYP